MSLFVEDTPRNNLAAWVSEAVALGTVSGAIVSPFSSPFVGNNYKPAAARVIGQLQDAGAEVWFDPATHALQMPGVGDFRYYDAWDLWGGARGDLGSSALQRDHVRRVLKLQSDLGVKPIGPGALQHATTGATSDLALSLAEAAIAERPDATVTIAGTPAFWSAEDDLDALVGSFAQLGATGWLLVVVRPTADLPVSAPPEEVAGLCRTARSLGQFGRVHVSHGDLAALPAVAAGAHSVGTGWDSRQRVCSYTSYEARDPSAGGGGWFKRPTLEGLVGFMPRRECERLGTQDPALAARLVPGPLHPDGPKEAFLHHAACLNRLIATASSGDFEARFRGLEGVYAAAEADWPIAAAAAGTGSLSPQWIGPMLDGLRAYATSEGWA
jgi:hypothetical protein